MLKSLNALEDEILKNIQEINNLNSDFEPPNLTTSISTTSSTESQQDITREATEIQSTVKKLPIEHVNNPTVSVKTSEDAIKTSQENSSVHSENISKVANFSKIFLQTVEAPTHPLVEHMQEPQSPRAYVEKSSTVIQVVDTVGFDSAKMQKTPDSESSSSSDDNAIGDEQFVDAVEDPTEPFDSTKTDKAAIYNKEQENVDKDHNLNAKSATNKRTPTRKISVTTINLQLMSNQAPAQRVEDVSEPTTPQTEEIKESTAQIVFKATQPEINAFNALPVKAVENQNVQTFENNTQIDLSQTVKLEVAMGKDEDIDSHVNNEENESFGIVSEMPTHEDQCENPQINVAGGSRTCIAHMKNVPAEEHDLSNPVSDENYNKVTVRPEEARTPSEVLNGNIHETTEETGSVEDRPESEHQIAIEDESDKLTKGANEDNIVATDTNSAQEKETRSEIQIAVEHGKVTKDTKENNNIALEDISLVEERPRRCGDQITTDNGKYQFTKEANENNNNAIEEASTVNEQQSESETQIASENVNDKDTNKISSETASFVEEKLSQCIEEIAVNDDINVVTEEAKESKYTEVNPVKERVVNITEENVSILRKETNQNLPPSGPKARKPTRNQRKSSKKARQRAEKKASLIRKESSSTTESNSDAPDVTPEEKTLTIINDNNVKNMVSKFENTTTDQDDLEVAKPRLERKRPVKKADSQKYAKYKNMPVKPTPDSPIEEKQEFALDWPLVEIFNHRDEANVETLVEAAKDIEEYKPVISTKIQMAQNNQTMLSKRPTSKIPVITRQNSVSKDTKPLNSVGSKIPVRSIAAVKKDKSPVASEDPNKQNKNNLKQVCKEDAKVDEKNVQARSLSPKPIKKDTPSTSKPFDQRRSLSRKSSSHSNKSDEIGQEMANSVKNAKNLNRKISNPSFRSSFDSSTSSKKMSYTKSLDNDSESSVSDSNVEELLSDDDFEDFQDDFEETNESILQSDSEDYQAFEEKNTQLAQELNINVNQISARVNELTSNLDGKDRLFNNYSIEETCESEDYDSEEEIELDETESNEDRGEFIEDEFMPDDLDQQFNVDRKESTDFEITEVRQRRHAMLECKCIGGS